MRELSDEKARLVERTLFGTAVATLIGYLLLALAILRHRRGRPSGSRLSRNGGHKDRHLLLHNRQ